MGGVERRGRRRGAARAWKHSQYFLRQPDFLQWQPLLCLPSASAELGAEWLILGRNADGLLRRGRECGHRWRLVRASVRALTRGYAPLERLRDRLLPRLVVVRVVGAVLAIGSRAPDS